jgi:hypothetical protein
VPTPVGPAPRDPDDPDFWDWSAPDDRPAARRHPATAIVALVIVAALVVLVLLSVL